MPTFLPGRRAFIVQGWAALAATGAALGLSAPTNCWAQSPADTLRIQWEGVATPAQPEAEIPQLRYLVQLVRGSDWLMRALRAARAVDAPDWWIGGGVL